MKKGITFALLFFTSVWAYGGSQHWLTNYDEALQQAKETNQLVLVNFTGSDWCGWCKRLHHEVFETPEFNRYAEEHLILLKIDFPRVTSQPPELKKQNGALAQKYGVNGFPSIVILDEEGNPIGRFGYERGGPERFLKKLKKIEEKAQKD